MVRQVLAQNVIALRDREFAELDNVTARNRALAARIGSTLGQVQRLVAGEVGTSVDSLEWLASALKVRPQDLLTPYFMAGIKPPQSPQPKPTERDEAELRRRSGYLAAPLSQPPGAGPHPRRHRP